MFFVFLRECIAAFLKLAGTLPDVSEVLIMVSTQGPIVWKTFLYNDAGKQSSEQDDSFIEISIFSSDSERGEKLSKIQTELD